ncbi:hypothetical protein [Mangrovicoccus sp. HB161399]|nr:hypothetical protein [Mangrovicoccus sp. HB161399]
MDAAGHAVQRWTLAGLRNRRFCSLAEATATILMLGEQLNMRATRG